MRRLQETYGVEMGQILATDVDSWNAQQASLYVREEHPDQWAAFDEAVFEALWVDGQDIGDVDVLAARADDVGLDPEAIWDTVANETWTDRLEAAHDEASRFGITDVPTFVSGEHAARGTVPPDNLRRLVEGARNE